MNRCEHKMRHTGHQCQLEGLHDGRHAHDPADEARVTQNEIFDLVLIGGEASKLRAAELIRSLDPRARRDLRATLQTIEEMIDDVTLAEMRERRPWKL